MCRALSHDVRSPRELTRERAEKRFRGNTQRRDGPGHPGSGRSSTPAISVISSLVDPSMVPELRDPYGLTWCSTSWNGVGMADEALADVRRCERLARPGRHLDQCPRMVVPQGPFQVRDGLELGTAQAALVVRECGLLGNTCPQGVVCPRSHAEI